MASKLNDREIEIGAHPQCTQSHRADNIGRYVPENNDCLSFSKTAIFSSAVREDIHDLIHSYNEKNTLEFPSFGSIWKNRKYSLIHFGGHETQNRYVFISGVIEILLLYLSPDESLTTQAAAVYALYLMYFTQPTRFSKIPIRLTTNSWNLLESVYKKAFENKAGDLIYVIRKLRSSNAFVYVAQEEPISKPLMGANEYIADQTEKSLLKIENTLHDNVLVPIEPLLSDMSSLAMEYKKAKAGLVSLALSRRSSEMVMEQLLLSKPANMNLNEAKPLPAFLSEESTLGTVSIPTRVFSNNTTTEEVTTIAKSLSNLRTEYSLSDNNTEIDKGAVSSQSFSLASQTVQPISTPTIPVSLASQVLPGSNSNNASLSQSGLPTNADSTPTVTMPLNSQYSSQVINSERRMVTSGAQSILPSVFPLSMLQSTTTNISMQVEDITKNYFKNRLLRYEFTSAGGLTMNENEYPDTLFLSHRLKKRELEKERRLAERRERKIQRSKRKHDELTRKLREAENEDESIHDINENSVAEETQGQDNQDCDIDKHGLSIIGEEVVINEAGNTIAKYSTNILTPSVVSEAHSKEPRK